MVLNNESDFFFFFIKYVLCFIFYKCLIIIFHFYSSDDSSSETSCDSNSDNENSIVSIPFVKEENVKTKGELDISDLPPIEDLKISVDEDKCQPIGCIKSIVDTLGKYRLWILVYPLLKKFC